MRCKDLQFKFVKIPVQNWGEWMSCWTRTVFLICRKPTNPCHSHDNWWFLRLNQHLIYFTLPSYNWNQFQIDRSSTTNTHHHPHVSLVTSPLQPEPWPNPYYIHYSSNEYLENLVLQFGSSRIFGRTKAVQRSGGPALNFHVFSLDQIEKKVGFRTGNHQNSHEIPWNPPLNHHSTGLQDELLTVPWKSQRTQNTLCKWMYPLVNIQKTMEHHHFLWENSLFLWPFSIAILNYQRVSLNPNNRSISLPKKVCMLQDVLNYWIHCKVL